MAGFVLNLNGFEQLEKKLKTLNENIVEGVDKEINASALRIQKAAKRAAPVNFGTLRNSIITESPSKLTAKIVVGASYGAFVEFGTGGKVSIPSGYESLANQFKGQKTGSYYDFLMALVDWIKKKGIKAGTYNISTRRRVGNKATKFNEDVIMAERIAYSILKKGIRAQPYLIPAYEAEKPRLIQNLKRLINVKS